MLKYVQIDIQTDRQPDIQTDIETEREKDTDRQTNRQTQIDRQRKTHRHEEAQRVPEQESNLSFQLFMLTPQLFRLLLAFPRRQIPQSQLFRQSGILPVQPLPFT